MAKTVKRVELPHYTEDRRCQYCDIPINHLPAKARFCSERHRVAAHRAAKVKLGNDPGTPESEGNVTQEQPETDNWYLGRGDSVRWPSLVIEAFRADPNLADLADLWERQFRREGMM